MRVDSEDYIVYTVNRTEGNTKFAPRCRHQESSPSNKYRKPCQFQAALQLPMILQLHAPKRTFHHIGSVQNQTSRFG